MADSDQSGDERELETAPEASTEPSNADLAAIIGESAGDDNLDADRDEDGDDDGDDEAPARKPGKKPAAKSGDEADDEDGDDQDAGDDDAGSEDDAGDDDAAAAEAGSEDDDDQAGDDADPDADPEAELDEEDQQTRASFNPAQQKKFDRAVQKKARIAIEARAEAAEAKQTIARLERELEERSQPVALTPTADNPLADVDDEATLEKRLANARALRNWCRTHRKGGVIKNGDKEIEIDADRAAEMLDEAEDLINEHGPERRKFLQERANGDRAAVTEHPWLKDKKSAGSLQVENMLRKYGGKRLRDLPFVRLALADMVLGQVMRTKQKAAAGKGGKADQPGAKKGNPPKAPAAPGRGSPPPKVAGAGKARTAAHKTLHEKGDDPGNEALSDLLARG